ncbi:hypothetical protein G7085_03750 [Tessaracoccus sp. HDW20]|uniref:hypothetical protein n=1 Tax=Tessaracoccus coleopterorum TaxID=2714950 RepID=UPI0018D27AB3|nr:hypothetical protein [Tessaracoccus coleopterorum]NHB84060.1 hypothetical protein [Tessaracoccus coleopterorum]
MRAVGVLIGMLACSILSYHLIEQPIRSGGLSAWFTPRRVAAAVLAVMVFFVSWAAVLHNSIALVHGRRVLVVGDSVPSD